MYLYNYMHSLSLIVYPHLNAFNMIIHSFSCVSCFSILTPPNMIMAKLLKTTYNEQGQYFVSSIWIAHLSWGTPAVSGCLLFCIDLLLVVLRLWGCGATCCKLRPCRSPGVLTSAPNQVLRSATSWGKKRRMLKTHVFHNKSLNPAETSEL